MLGDNDVFGGSRTNVFGSNSVCIAMYMLSTYNALCSTVAGSIEVIGAGNVLIVCSVLLL